MMLLYQKAVFSRNTPCFVLFHRDGTKGKNSVSLCFKKAKSRPKAAFCCAESYPSSRSSVVWEKRSRSKTLPLPTFF